MQTVSILRDELKDGGKKVLEKQTRKTFPKKAVPENMVPWKSHIFTMGKGRPINHLWLPSQQLCLRICTAPYGGRKESQSLENPIQIGKQTAAVDQQRDYH